MQAAVYRPFIGWLKANPVVLKELRSRMRGSRAFWMLTAYLVLLSIGMIVILLGYAASERSGAGGFIRPVIGKALFGMAFGLELLTISFIAPALTAGAISSEREQNTIDLLRTTLLSARAMVLGKLFTSLSYLILLLFTALPFQSLAFLFGGIATEEVLISILLLFVTSLAFCSMGLFFSSFLRRTLMSTALSYGCAVLLVFGLPMALILGLVMFGRFFPGLSQDPNSSMIVFLLLIGWILVSVNPIATAILSELLFLQEQALFTFSYPLPEGETLTIISPWISYSFTYLIISFLLIWLSIRMVRRVEK
jgi:ABC-type transport system involved in multi-copper enzyme maturation permease subunit